MIDVRLFKLHTLAKYKSRAICLYRIGVTAWLVFAVLLSCNEFKAKISANVAGRTFEDSNKNREIFVSLAVLEELLGEHERLNVERRIYDGSKFLSLHNGPPVRIYRT